jgi:hypothetical protein
MTEISGRLELRSLDATTTEHNARIMAHVEALHELAEMVDTADPDIFARHFQIECEFISTQLLPHIEAVETSIYRELDRLMERRHSMAPMREEHERLRRLFASLCGYRAAVELGVFDKSDAIGLRRVLYRLYSLLKVHMAEEEMYLRVIERDLTPEEKDIVARGIDHAAAEPV